MHLGTPEIGLNKDHLTTHALTIGMTGSGKTGLGIVMLEELARLRIPVLVLDIKGDLTHIATSEEFRNSIENYTIRTYVPEEAAELPPFTNSLMYNASQRLAIPPAMTIVYLAHLNFNERAEFITRLLSDFDTWMRKMNGSAELRGLIHIDEIHGLIPPVKKSPVKMQLLTLLKQARGFGYGISLATQNPGDLDYRALSNIGTWFVGKLLTKRDRKKVVEGLESAVDEDVLTTLKQRQFFFRSVHTSGVSILNVRDVESAIGGPVALHIALQHSTPDLQFKWRCPETETTSRVGADHDNYERKCQELMRSQQLENIESLRQESKAQYEKLTKEIERTQTKYNTEVARAKDKGLASGFSAITAIVGALTGKKAVTASNISRTGSAIRNANQAGCSKKKVDELKAKVAELKATRSKVYEEFKKKQEETKRPPQVYLERHDLWAALR